MNVTSQVLSVSHDVGCPAVPLAASIDGNDSRGQRSKHCAIVSTTYRVPYCWYRWSAWTWKGLFPLTLPAAKENQAYCAAQLLDSYHRGCVLLSKKLSIWPGTSWNLKPLVEKLKRKILADLHTVMLLVILAHLFWVLCPVWASCPFWASCCFWAQRSFWAISIIALGLLYTHWFLRSCPLLLILFFVTYR